MFVEMFKQLKIAFMFLVIFTILTGIIYPFVMTGIAQLFFSWKANGSYIEVNNEIIGSELIGQYSEDSHYFWSRPSATPMFSYNASNSSGSNLGPLNSVLLDGVSSRVSALRKIHGNRLIPVDLVTASGSGLDPDISPYSAFYQASRVAKENHLSENKVNALIKKMIKSRSLWILGEPRVNVLELNIALDKLRKVHEG